MTRPRRRRRDYRRTKCYGYYHRTPLSGRQPRSGRDRATQDGGLQRSREASEHWTGSARPVGERGGNIRDLGVRSDRSTAFEWHGGYLRWRVQPFQRACRYVEGMMLETDVLVIGAGAAGLMAARAASAAGASVVIVDKSIIGRGGATIMAQMTTAVALGAAEPDSVELHAEDTWIGSRDLGDHAIIDVICARGPELIGIDEIGMHLERVGVDRSYAGQLILHPVWSTGSAA